jgi:hypothetical protein
MLMEHSINFSQRALLLQGSQLAKQGPFHFAEFGTNVSRESEIDLNENLPSTDFLSICLLREMTSPVIRQNSGT